MSLSSLILGSPLSAPCALDTGQESSFDEDKSKRWWANPRYPRPITGLTDDPEVQAMALGLFSEVAEAPEKSSRALAHLLWAVASWARRRYSPSGVQIQVTYSYIEQGAEVGRRPAGWALEAFRRWTGAESRGGWIACSTAILEAVWIALGWVQEQGFLAPPSTPPSTLEPAFPIEIHGEKRRGKTRCGCLAHAHGDRDPSLLYDLGKGLGTCAVSGEVFALLELPEGLIAHRIIREIQPDISQMINKDTPIGAYRADQGAHEAGAPGPAPRSLGLAMGKLWESGLSLGLSSASSMEGWAEWMARRWGGKAGALHAWDALIAYEKSGESPRNWMPERFVGIGWYRPASVEWVEGAGGRRWPVLELEERGTGHVLFDIDDCPYLPGEAPLEMVERLRLAVENRGIFGKITWIMRTSSTGIQVMVRLKQFRWDVRGFYQSQAVTGALQEMGQRLTAIVGGRIDPSAWAPKRMARAPGYRIKEGIDRAILWYTGH